MSILVLNFSLFSWLWSNEKTFAQDSFTTCFRFSDSAGSIFYLCICDCVGMTCANLFGLQATKTTRKTKIAHIGLIVINLFYKRYIEI